MLAADRSRTHAAHSSDTKAKAAVSLCFTASFFAYVVTPGTIVLTVPVALLVMIGVICLFLKGSRAAEILTNLIAGPATVLLIFCAFWPTLVSATLDNIITALYGILMICVLAACSIIVTAIGMHAILEAFFYSSLICEASIFAFEWHDLFGALSGGGRFLCFHFHPNLIAIIATSYVVVQLWQFTSRRSYVALTAAVGSFAIMFAASSRGALVAAIAALLFGFVLRNGSIWKHLRPRRLAIYLLVLVCLSPLIFTPMGDKAEKWTIKILDLDSRWRGLHSGMSGRIPEWLRASDFLMHDGDLIYGHGFRTSFDDLGIIDNSILVELYEIGAIGTIALLTVFGFRFYILVRSAVASRDERQKQFLAVCASLATAIFVVNLVDRYLFGIGNPASLLGLFIFVSRKTDYLAPRSQQSEPMLYEDARQRRLAVGV